MTSTALVPASMYNASALVELEPVSLKDLKRSAHQIQKRGVLAIKSTVQGICIEGALSVLDAFGYKGTHFHYNQNRWETDDLVNEEYFPECQGRMAHETPVFWFWGGPPGRLKWYRGTLQTLLEDRILCEIMERGAEEVAKWIGTDLTEVPR